MRCALAALVCLFLLSWTMGCEPTQLGECDQNLATTVVFDTSGNPAYAGQAMVEMACSGCHSQPAVGASRRGAPHGLDFDMVGSRTSDPDSPDEDALARVAAARDIIFDWREDMFSTVEDGSMPPGEVGQAAFINSGYSYPDGSPLEEIDSVMGQELYKNWLACGGPVIERTGDEGMTCGETTGEGYDCAIRSGGEAPVDATWTAIYSQIIQPKCAMAGCHNDSTANNGMLSFADSSTALTSLVGVDPMGPMCMGSASRLVAGDADGSLLIHKLEAMDASGARVCATPMPIGTPLDAMREIAPIRAWIDAGAMDN